MTVDELVAQLGARGFDAAPLHGDMPQGRRDGVMLRFRSGRAKLLVATNVAARGLDISHVSHVFSYDVPDDPEEYTHRIGRTGRVGRNGIAYTFMTEPRPQGRGRDRARDGRQGASLHGRRGHPRRRAEGAPARDRGRRQRGRRSRDLTTPEVEIALPGRVTESIPSQQGPITGAAATNGAANGAAATNGAARRRTARPWPASSSTRASATASRATRSPRPSRPAASSPGACACTTRTVSSTFPASERTRRSRP